MLARAAGDAHGDRLRIKRSCASEEEESPGELTTLAATARDVVAVTVAATAAVNFGTRAYTMTIELDETKRVQSVGERRKLSGVKTTLNDSSASMLNEARTLT